MDLFRFALLVVTGFTACAEFGSYAFVHLVLRRLPREYHLQVEQGLLRTFGRVMPTLMTLCAALAVAYAIHVRQVAGPATWLFVTAAASFVAALISTIVFNVSSQSDCAGKFQINNLPYGPNTPPITVPLGATQIWEVQNSSAAPHPFHIHVNPFVVI